MRLRIVVTVAAALVSSLVFVGSTLAADFGITEFKLQTIRGTSEVEAPQHSGRFIFANEPYEPAYTQAGGHPWGLTTTIAFTSETIRSGAGGTTTNYVPTRDPKDVVVNLPPGLLGDPLAAPRCSLTHVTSGGSEQCPAGTQVGVYLLEDGGGQEVLAPIVDVTPEAGQSAEFALENTVKAVDTPLLTGRLVRTSDGYGFAVTSNEIPVVGVTRVEATFWGVPADPSHDPMRGRICHSDSATESMHCEGGGEKAGVAAAPFLTMPTDCAAGPERATARADSWEEPGSVSVGGQYQGYVTAKRRSPRPPAATCYRSVRRSKRYRTRRRRTNPLVLA